MRIAFLLVAFLFPCGVFGQDFVMVFLNKKENKAVLPEAEVKQIMDGHLANINRLAKEGKLWAAGPFDSGGGIFIFKSRSKAEVTDWLSTDPGIRASRWNVEIYPYTPRTGSVCSVGENYEMTNYYFVRYSVQSTKYSIGAMAESLQSHLSYLRQWSGGVIAEGSLGEEEGNILVLKEEPPAERVTSDPAVKNGALKADVKKLFIARGSFCEPKP